MEITRNYYIISKVLQNSNSYSSDFLNVERSATLSSDLILFYVWTMAILALPATQWGIWALGFLGVQGEICLKFENSLIKLFINLFSKHLCLDRLCKKTLQFKHHMSPFLLLDEKQKTENHFRDPRSSHYDDNALWIYKKILPYEPCFSPMFLLSGKIHEKLPSVSSDSGSATLGN